MPTVINRYLTTTIVKETLLTTLTTIMAHHLDGIQFTTADHIGITPRTDLEVIQASDARSEYYSGVHREGKCFVGQLIHVKHHSQMEGSSKTLLTKLRSYATNAQNGARQRIAREESRQYDRMLLFADLNSPNGRCFVVINRFYRSTLKLLHHSSASQEGIGKIFVLEEPDPVTNTLGSSESVDIVDQPQRCYPVTLPVHTAVPQYPLRTPDVGETRYFAVHGDTSVIVSMAHATQAMCSGSFCDRSMYSDNPMHKCGCLHTNGKHSLVIECDVTIAVRRDFDPSGQRTITKFRSWTTSQLFVHNDTWAKIDLNTMDNLHLPALRTSIRNIVQYINDNGGWSITGWVRTGAVTDASDPNNTVVQDAENLANVEQKPKISYLYPTDTTILSPENHDYPAKFEI